MLAELGGRLVPTDRRFRQLVPHAVLWGHDRHGHHRLNVGLLDLDLDVPRTVDVKRLLVRLKIILIIGHALKEVVHLFVG